MKTRFNVVNETYKVGIDGFENWGFDPVVKYKHVSKKFKGTQKIILIYYKMISEGTIIIDD